MSINILPGTKEALDQMKGQVVVPHEGEGVVYVKIAFIKPETMCDGDPAQVVENAPGVILCGQLAEIQTQISKWFAESQAEYLTATKKPDIEQPQQEKW